MCLSHRVYLETYQTQVKTERSGKRRSKRTSYIYIFIRQFLAQQAMQLLLTFFHYYTNLYLSYLVWSIAFELNMMQERQVYEFEFIGLLISRNGYL